MKFVKGSGFTGLKGTRSQSTQFLYWGSSAQKLL